MRKMTQGSITRHLIAYALPLILGNIFQLTYNAVEAFQRLFGFDPNGEVDSATWNAIIDTYEDLYNGNRLNPGQYPGYAIS